MNIRPVASKHEIGANIKTTNVSAAKDRAMAVLLNGKPAETQQANAQASEGPDLSAMVAHNQAQVQNQNAVSPEELSNVMTNGVKTMDETPSSEPTEVTPAPEQDPALSRQFAQLSRQEKALRAKQQQQDQQFRQREADLKAREDAISAKDQQYNNGYISKDKLKSNPLLALAEVGVDYNAITEQILNQNTVDPRVEAHISDLKAQIAELKDANSKRDQTRQDEQKTNYENAKRQILADTKTLVSQDETYEIIKATGSYQDVVDLIEETYKKDGILMTVEEASKEVADYLEEQTIKLTQTNRIKAKLQASTTSVAKPNEQKTQDPKQTQVTMKTLTNAATASRPMTNRERALAAFNRQKIG